MAIPIINVSILNGSNGFSLSGTGSHQVSNAGDINGDGFGDVIVGTSFSYNSHDYGYSYAVFGKVSGFESILGLSSLDGNNGFGSIGRLVSNAGDINGDGFSDVIIVDVNDSGYVVFGKASGFDAMLNLFTLDGNNGFRLIAGGLNSLSNAGDVNGDGFDDLIVGAPNADASGDRSGSSYVVFGKASGFSAVMDLFGLDGNNGFRLDGVAGGDISGSSVSGAGDVNGDGFDDLIVGAPDADPNGGRSGSSYVVFGKASGFSAAMNLSSLNGSNGFRLDGGAVLDDLGVSVSNAGDVNGDGFDDLLVGAPSADPNGDSSGSSYVIFGKASGFSAEMNLSGLDGNNGFRLDGGAAEAFSGVSVSNAGDINGDGFDDLIVGASGADSSYVFFGKTTGFSAVMDLSDLDGSNGFRLNGPDNFGTSVSSAGDVNGDGFDDLIIGAAGDDYNDIPASYVVFGGNFITGEAVYLGTPGDDHLTGTAVAERFEAGGGNDTIIGLGGEDVFHADAGDDTIVVSDLDFELVDGGTGNDTLVLGERDINLNLANFHNMISGTEIIDLTSDGANTLTLTLADLLGLSDTTNTFTVNGDVNDRIFGLGSDGWADGGIDESRRQQWVSPGWNGRIRCFWQIGQQCRGCQRRWDR